MSRTAAVLGSRAWLVMAPGTLALYVPWVFTRWRFGPPLFDGEASRWLGVVWAVFHAFVLSYEEPTERRRFGAEYARYCAAVPRWIPRLRPWKG